MRQGTAVIPQSGERKPGDLMMLDLLKMYGFDQSCRAKLVRHQSKKYDIQELVRKRWLDAYQQFQTRPIFKGLDCIVSFVGFDGTKATFIGVFDVLGLVPPEERALPSVCPYKEWLEDEYCYRLERRQGFESLENRLVVDWGLGSRSWSQWLTDRRVLEILPEGQEIELFKDYLDFTLTHDELQLIISRPDSHREWKARLSAVAGIYLILDTLTGDQYVGSAYGTEGIWGRWAQYAKNGHGGNEALRKLTEANPAYPGCFTLSILQILPVTTSRKEVVELEQRFKAKLGTRTTGLNLN